MVTLQALTYIESHGRTGRTIWNYATGLWHPHRYSNNLTLWHPDTMLNLIALSISTVEKCAPMQVVKQREQWEASATEE